MVELIIGTYGLICWLVFKKFRLIPVNAYTVCSAIMIGIAMIGILGLLLLKYQPASSDGRLYTVTTPVVPQVSGQVIAVPVIANVPLREGDVLFQIDPAPYKYEVNRLEAKLAAANTNLSQLEKRLLAAEAARSQAQADVLASESEYDRQAQQQRDQAEAGMGQVSSQLSLARKDYVRYKELVEKGTISRQKFEQVAEQVERLEAQLREAKATLAQAEEAITGGGASLQSARERLRQAQAQEEEARLELESQSDGVNPDVQQVVAELGLARWRLEETTVRAPADGYVTQLALRPGQMTTTLPLAPVMVFVHDEQPTLVATFPQNVIVDLKPGLEAEIAFKAYPGKIFKGRVSHLLATTAEGQFTTGGQLRTATAASAPGRIPVVFDYGPDIADLKLPGGAQATTAIYTEHVHVLAIIRKIILRIKSWENYLFLP
ncbi:MAG: HlyD family secretion protein [Rhodospirillaceae bacterium]|nr:MAG: HlyD family secretion protein [Rhodospirillaceae bacterium]